MPTTVAQDTPPVQANTEPRSRNSRAVLPLWRIKGRFTLATPLHIGNGQDEPITQEGQENFVAQVARDHTNQPYLPGSGIKGALRALALRADLSPEVCQRLFGSMDASDCTTPARVEFCNAYLVTSTQTASGLPGFDASKQRALLPHSVRNRDYGTVQDKLMFTEQVVPPGSQFDFECTAQNLTQEDIQTLLGILDLAGRRDSSFQLGGRKASDNGRVSWVASEVCCIKDFSALWKTVQTNPSTPVDLWASGVVQQKLPPKPLTLTSDQLLVLNSLELKFHTPFLVYQKIDKKAKPERKNGPDAEPRTNHAGREVLPASSLHGALRSQAERILRTLGKETPEGYKVPAVFGLDEAATLNLAAVLFGAPGWRGVLQCSDFLAPPNSPTIDHHMVAIDRLTGGGKDSAKFSIKALDCPTLTGSIRIDLGRLSKLAGKNHDLKAQSLGLLAHVLRDLDEGDIALGYGATKGYGRSHGTCISKLGTALATLAASSDLNAALQAFVDAMPETSAGVSAQNVLAQPQAALPVTHDRTGDFHNPYVFLPLPTLSSKDDRLPWVGYEDIPTSHHSHAAFHANALHGRILCRLVTQTPIFIGAGELKNTQDPTQQKNFTMAKRQVSNAIVLRDQIALPATSLRGMLSSLHESISKSALRVMHDREYSVRASESQALPHKGVVKKDVRTIGGKDRTVWVIQDDESRTDHLIPAKALRQLERLSDERTAEAEKSGAVLPEIKPRGVARNPDAKIFGAKARLMVGQKIYYALGVDRKITEMAYSQIWRKIVAFNDQPWLTKNALPKDTDTSHAPLQNNSKRNVLSPSEMLFGFVQDMGEDYKKLSAQEKAANPALAFASKVRFGFGLSATPVKTDAEVTLKILASPKPPSPAMYFKPKEGRAAYISKAELASNPTKYVLQGRKTYLHALKTQAGEVQHLDANGKPVAEGQGSSPWTSANQQDAKQKVRVKPITKGETFFFEVDFVNLSQTELESLCATLVPHPNYQHKLGMGKPIGLGSVKIEPVGLYIVNRQTRYRQVGFGGAGASPQRYDSVWKCADFPPTLPFHFEREHKATATDGHMVPPEQLAQQQMSVLKTTEPALYNAITLTGNPDAVKHPVHYPQVRAKPIETKTYEWFVENDRVHGAKQHIAPFTGESNALPALKRIP